MTRESAKIRYKVHRTVAGPDHVVPVRDVYPHALSEDCACRPNVVRDSGGVVATVFHAVWDEGHDPPLRNQIE